MVFDEWSNENKHLGWGDINVSFFFSICIATVISVKEVEKHYIVPQAIFLTAKYLI